MSFENNITGYRSGGVVDTSSSSGDILGTLAGSAGIATVGNLIGNEINYRYNRELQDNQLRNQIELQNRAFQHNQTAVQNQARLQALGMQQAGLSAANVAGTGAPSLQAGAAAGATSSMLNVFSGIADLIAAVKAPTEIEKAVAETELAKSGSEKSQAETGSLIPSQVTQLLASAGKLSEDIRGAKNANDWLEAQNDFLRKQSPAIFENRIAALKASKQWDNLPPATRNTLEELALGKYGIEIGIGEIEALNKVIDSQRAMSATDRELLENTRDIITAYSQISDKAIMHAIAALPLNQQNLMKAQVAEYYALANQAKTQADLNKLEKWITEHTNDQYLIEYGMSEQIERNKYIDLLNQVLRFPSAVMNMVPAATAGAVAGAAARGSAAAPPPVDTRGLYKYFR